MSNDEAGFNELKNQFGSGDNADQLTLYEFVALPDARAEGLANRIVDIKLAGEVLKIRLRAKQALQSPPVGQLELFSAVLSHQLYCSH